MNPTTPHDTSRPLSVTLLTREYPPEVYGGAGVVVEHLARELAHSVDVEVRCFGADRRPPGAVRSVVAYRPSERLSGSAPHLAALRALSVDLAMVADLQAADIVHSHTWYANFAGHLAKLIYGIPHVMTVHSLEPLRPWKQEQLGGGYRVSSFVEQSAIESADGVIAVSEAEARDVLSVYPAVRSDRVHVIPNGVDPDVYRPAETTGVLERLGLEPWRPVVLFVGRISRQKGIDHFLRASARFDPDVQVVLRAGAADTAELNLEVAAWVERARASGRHVVWIPDVLERSEMVQLLSAAAVSCCPSIYEPFGLVNVEAMACGAPVVASAVGGIPEIVDDGVTGLLVPFDRRPDGEEGPADPEAFARDLAHAVNCLVADPNRRKLMGEAARERVLEHYTWEAAARETVRVYRSLLSD